VRDEEILLDPLESSREASQQLLALLAVRIDRKHHELVAADASDEVRLAKRLAQHIRDDFQRVITTRMAVGVVDALEVIEIAEEEDAGLAASPRDLELLAHVRVKAAAIEQPGEIVGQGQLAHHRLQPLALDRVAERALQEIDVDVALHEVVLRAALHRLQPDRLVVERRLHDDRHFGCMLAHTLERLDSLAIREDEIQQDDVELLLAKPGERGRQAIRRDEIELRCLYIPTARARQHRGDEMGVPLIVFDEEQCDRRGGHDQ
jgi:hypothetical protein